MKIKLYILIVTIVVLVSCNDKEKNNIVSENEKPLPATTNKQQNFEESVALVLNAFKEQNNTFINKHVHPDKGVMIIYRIGVFNEYTNTDKIDFEYPIPANFPYPIITEEVSLQYEELPDFNCGTMQWSKHGLYCDTIKKDTLLSGTPQNLIKYRGDNIPASEVERLKRLESKSRRVVLAQRDNSLIFYLTLIDKKWYLTAIDRITTDCSA